MARGKKTAAEKSTRGSSSTLDVVKEYLQTNKCPAGYDKNDKRALKRRAQSFVLIGEDLYYTCGRSRHSNGDAEETAENPESYPDYTQVLRKCLLAEEEREEAVTRAHIADDGQHLGMERTTERLASQYYWLGIISSVRNMIRKCSYCASRSRGPFSASSTNSTTMVVLPPQDGDDVDDAEEVVKIEKPDPFFAQNGASSYFWQKVEVQIFGPFQSGKDQVYVAVALDTYSQYPEAVVLQSVTMASFTNFILTLVCRYGVMDKLVMLQNEVTKDLDLCVNVSDVQQAGIAFTQIFTMASPTDGRWKHIERSLEQFVSFYPSLWDKCLEVFMVPLRISLPSEAEYSPSYLTFGRELRFPEQLNHRHREDWQQAEMQFTTEQEQHTVDLLMQAFGLYSNTPSVPVAAGAEVKPGIDRSCKTGNIAPEVPTDVSEEPVKRRRGRPKKVQRKDDSDSDFEPAQDMQAEHENSCFPDGIVQNENTTAPAVEDNQETPGIRTSKRKRTVTFKLQEVLKNRRLKQKPTTVSNKAEENVKAPKVAPQPEEPAPRENSEETEKTKADKKQHASKKRRRSSVKKVKRALRDNTTQQDDVAVKIASILGQLALDVYYFILKLFKERGTFPSQLSTPTQAAIQELSQSVELRDGKLYSCEGKSAGRVIITQEKARFSLLRKAHVRGKVHYDRNAGLKHLMDMNVFWKGMSLDLDAFIHACPECVAYNPMHNKPEVRIPSKSKVLPADRDDSDPHLSEDEEEGDCSYEDIVQYLTDGSFPDGISEDKKSYIEMRASSFSIISGSLHYQSSNRPNAPHRQVLFADSVRQTAILEAHIEEGSHLSQQDTQAKLREKYFWSGMTYDVIRYIATCCMAGVESARPIPHRNPVIQTRVEKFCKYHQEGIPVFERSVLTASQTSSVTAGPENESASVTTDGEGETALANLQNTSTCLPDADGQQRPHNYMEEMVVRRAVETIIGEVGGTSTYADPEESCVLPMAPVAPNLNKSGRKRTKRDCHKCDHCGKLVSGTVRFRAHVYKHTGIKPFTCSTCNKSFTTRKSLQVHMRKHTGVRPYLCNQCGREFFRYTSFRYHVKSHTQGKQTPLPCDQCNRTFATQNRLDRHKEFKHPAVPRVHMCNQCGKVFSAARSLKWHEQSHTGARKHQCQLCPKSFVRKDCLDTHMKIHTAGWETLTAKDSTEHPVTDPVGELTVTVSQPGGEVLTISAREPSEEVVAGVIQWTDDDNPQVVTSIPPQNLIVTDLDVYHTQVQTSDNETAHVLSAAHLHPTVHLAPASSLSDHPSIHTLHPTDILLPEGMPVQYEVECLSGDPSALTEADLNAVQMLAHASISGQNIMQHLGDRT